MPAAVRLLSTEHVLWLLVPAADLCVAGEDMSGVKGLMLTHMHRSTAMPEAAAGETE